MTEAAPKTRSVVSWGLLDQVVSSGANFVFIVIVARSLAPEGFGSVALGLEVYFLTLFAARGVAGDTLAARFSGLSRGDLRDPTRAAAGVAVAVGTVAALLTAAAATFTAPPVRSVLLVVAISLPVLVLQDFIRQALIVQGRARSTCLNDLLWAVLQLPMLWFAVRLDPVAYVLVAGWAAAGALTALVGLAQLQVGFVPDLGVRAWLREHRSLWPYFLGDNLLFAASSFIIVLAISGSTGLAGLAAFRAAMTVYAPLSTIGRGVISVAVALLARRRDEPEWIKRSSLWISWSLAPSAFVWGGFVALLPASVGTAVLGQSWEGAQPLVFLAGFPVAVGLFSVGAACGMRALGAGRHGFGARVVVTVLGLSCAGVGGYMGGVRGALIGLACLAPFQVAVWWWLLNDAARRSRLRQQQSHDGDTTDTAVIDS